MKKWGLFSFFYIMIVAFFSSCSHDEFKYMGNDNVQILKKKNSHFIFRSAKEDKRYAGDFSLQDSILYLHVNTIDRSIITVSVQFEVKGYALGDSELELRGIRYKLKDRW